MSVKDIKNIDEMVIPTHTGKSGGGFDIPEYDEN
jgi:hypothetical protein